MSDNYYGFEKFLSLLDDNNILKKTTAMGVMVHLQKCIEEIKSNVLTDLLSIDEIKKDHYLDLKINEIKRQDYLKGYGINKIERWLKKFNVSIEDVIQNTVNSDYFYKMVDGYYEQNFDPGTTEYNISSAAQNDFLLYFLNYYANELISFLESKKSTFTGEIIKKENIKSRDISETIAEKFYNLKETNKRMADEIQATYGNDIFADHSDIELKYEFQIDTIKDEIKQLVSDLYGQSKKDNYYYFDCPSEVYINYFEKRKEEYLIEVPEANESEFLLSEIKYFSEPYNNRIIKGNAEYDYNDYIEYTDRYRISLKRKLEFLAKKLKPYGYAIKYKEGEALIDETNGNYRGWGTEIVLEKTENKSEDIPEVEYKSEKQLTTNQIVLLLQETGFFSHPKIEKAPKTRQSELISKICGLNVKNLKKKIESLDKSPKELGKNHQKDIDKIEDILNKLE